MITIALWFSLAIAALGAALFLYKSAHDQAGEVTVNEMRDRALQQKSDGGTLPSAKAVRSIRVLGFLPGPTVTYQPTGRGCIVYYNQWPLGPKYGVKCNSGTWQVLSS